MGWVPCLTPAPPFPAGAALLLPLASSQPPASWGETLPPVASFASSCLTLFGSWGSLPTVSAHRSSGRLSARSPHVPGDFGASSARWMWLLCGTIMAAWGESLEQAGRQGDAVPGGNPWLFLTLFSFCLLCAPLQMVITSQSPSVWAAGPRGAGWEAPFSCCKGLLGKQEPRRG